MDSHRTNNAATAAAITWMMLTTTAILVAQTSASGNFQVQLTSFSNAERVNAFGNCCSWSRSLEQNATTTSPSSSSSSSLSLCRLSCQTFFRICFSHYQATIPDDPVCTYGQHTAALLGNNSFVASSSSFSSSATEGEGSAGGGPVGGSVPGTLASDVSFPFSFTWPSTFSLIVEAWHEDDKATGSPHNLIARVAIQRSKDPGEDWQELVQTNGTVRMAFRYRVTCSDHYYGTGCSEICKPRDDKFGHYRCQANGSKICLPGWSGLYCDKAVCLPGCNEHMGYCDLPNECKCRLGWQGLTCDSCIRYPGCEHGTCKEPWTCNCLEGWGGLFCNQDLNFCTNHQPCRNGATCINTGQGSYTCVCSPDFTGTNCEIERNDCRLTNRSCLNDAKCTEIGEAEFECWCPEGLYGRRCELRVANSCEEQPCRNSGTCVSVSGAQKYQCNCAKGFTGINCEQQMDECKSQPCLNGGSCIDELNGFRCMCPIGYLGNRCQDNRNECADNPCLNGGVCDDKIDDFECRCRPGFVGPLCQDDVDECLNLPCANGAACRDLPNGFDCTCTPGFTGKFCSIKIDTCTNRPCLNGATCVASVDTYRCTCAKGYHGNRCELSSGGNTGSSRAHSTVGGGVVVATKTVATPSDSVPIVVTASTISDQIINSGDVQSLINNNNNGGSSLPLAQVILIVCLGVGIPLMLMLAAILLLVIRKHRRDAQASRLTSVQQENDVNQTKRLNNKNLCLESDSQSVPPDNSVYLNLIDSKETHRNSSSNVNCSQPNPVNVHLNYSRKQNNLKRLTSKDVNIDLEV